MNFTEALTYLHSANDLGVRPGLARVSELLKRLGDPQRAYPVVHIAGTNGKGSVSAYCAHIAAVTGKKVGWFTSPYLENFNERIRIIDGRQGLAEFQAHFRSPEIQDEEFAALMEEIKAVNDEMMAEGFQMPTVFEMLTAAAYLHYARQEVDLAIIEVGMGGRLDSTNVISKSLVSVITALGYDHMDRLGSTLPEIAGEKAGIIKEHCPVVLYDPRDIIETSQEGAAALRVVQEKARERDADLTLVSWQDLRDTSESREDQSFKFGSSERLWKIRLRGAYQKLNAALAIEAAKYFASEEEIAAGLYLATWPGRLELMQTDPPILIDGAHNVQGCAALAREIHSHFREQDFVYLLGVLADKEHEKMLRLVLDGDNRKPTSVYCTEAPVPRTMQAADLAAEVARIMSLPEEEVVSLDSPHADQARIKYVASLDEALRAALAEARREGKGLLAFGSLYVIGNLRPLLRHELWGQEL